MRQTNNEANRIEILLSLWAQEGWNLDALAKELGFGRNTVRRYLQSRKMYKVWKRNRIDNGNKAYLSHTPSLSDKILEAQKLLIEKGYLHSLPSSSWPKQLATEYALTHCRSWNQERIDALTGFLERYSISSTNGGLKSIDELCRGYVSQRTAYRVLNYFKLAPLITANNIHMNLSNNH